MKVKLLCSRVGADFAQNRGDEITVSDAEGMRMIDAGQAEQIGSDAPPPATNPTEQVSDDQRLAKTETTSRKRTGERAVKN